MKESWDFPGEGRHKRHNLQMPRGLFFSVAQDRENSAGRKRESKKEKSEKGKIGSWVGGATRLSLSLQGQSVMTNAP